MEGLLNFLEPLGFTVVRYDLDDRYVLATARGVDLDVYLSRGKSRIVYPVGAHLGPDEARRLGKAFGHAAKVAEFLERHATYLLGLDNIPSPSICL